MCFPAKQTQRHHIEYQIMAHLWGHQKVVVHPSPQSLRVRSPAKGRQRHFFRQRLEPRLERIVQHERAQNDISRTTTIITATIGCRYQKHHHYECYLMLTCTSPAISAASTTTTTTAAATANATPPPTTTPTPTPAAASTGLAVITQLTSGAGLENSELLSGYTNEKDLRPRRLNSKPRPLLAARAT